MAPHCPALSKNSYIKTETQHTVYLDILREYNRNTRCEYLLSDESYGTLARHCSFKPELTRNPSLLPCQTERNALLSLAPGIPSNSRTYANIAAPAMQQPQPWSLPRPCGLLPGSHNTTIPGSNYGWGAQRQAGILHGYGTTIASNAQQPQPAYLPQPPRNLYGYGTTVTSVTRQPQSAHLPQHRSTPHSITTHDCSNSNREPPTDPGCIGFVMVIICFIALLYYLNYRSNNS